MIRNQARARRRTVLTGASAAAALGASSACGDDGPSGTADDPVEIGFEWWGDENRADITQQAIDLFEQKNEGITVQPNFADYPPYWEGLTTRSASQDLPDVFQMDYPRLRQFGGSGMLTPLDGLVDTSDFRGSLLETGKVDGELLAVPVGANTNGLVYRADLFAEHDVRVPEPGYSWDDYGRIITNLTDALGEGTWGGEDWTLSYIFLEMWLLQQGSRFYAEDGSGLGFTQEQLVEWWNMTVPLLESGALPPPSTSAEWDDGMTEGAVASMIRWDNILTGLAPTVSEIGGELALAAPPTVDPDNLGIYFKPSMQFVIAANSEHPEEAGKLIDFLLNDPEAIAILGTNRGIPATNAGLENIEVDEHSQQILDYEDSVSEHMIDAPPPPPAAAGAVEAKFAQYFEQVRFEEYTPAEAAELYFGEAETLFSAEQ
ncbi:ABC transporter substrate-binding protein [Glycomyces xiaoerkulensis]|uniref:ABC transporter substrate-binding protein n=1 Tax=Glycomyces xiaoerkulensis TaxID=2038139 RepID=UPI000C2589D0|nr:extracellular solute-binding protein [Glycomyces xiaoerkulensis]